MKIYHFTIFVLVQRKICFSLFLCNTLHVVCEQLHMSATALAQVLCIDHGLLFLQI